MNYLRGGLTLIFTHEIQADKSSFVKITPPYINQPLVVCFIEVYFSINNRP